MFEVIFVGIILFIAYSWWNEFLPQLKRRIREERIMYINITSPVFFKHDVHVDMENTLIIQRLIVHDVTSCGFFAPRFLPSTDRH